MNPKSTPRATFTHIATALLVAGALHGATANAASFQYRHPVMGMVASPTAQAQQAATEILVALTGGPALPAGEVNWPYSYDLKQLLSVTGDPSYNASNVSWELQSGVLPAGLSLGTDGVLSGMPTTKDTVGSSFQVKATYKSKAGQQVYTIVVNGAVLHVTQISAGESHTCAVTTTGGVKCWGYNSSGQLGNGTRTSSAVPVQVSGLTTGVTSIAAGSAHTCAVNGDGVAKCWGYGEMSQLGPLSTIYQTTPVVVSTVLKFRAIATGGIHSCGIADTDALYCWGHNGKSQLGDGTTYTTATPKRVPGISAASVAAGGAHTCVVTTAGAASCWGLNDYGQVGFGNPGSYISSPGPVTALNAGVTAIAAGGRHTCAVVSGAVKCWGLNNNFQLGDGTSTSSVTPVSTSSLSNEVTQVSAGAAHSCAITNTGALWCWGSNGQGQLGDGTTAGKSTPALISGSGVTSVTAGTAHTCALTAQGTKCWGSDSAGQLGDDSSLVSKLAPTAVAP